MSKSSNTLIALILGGAIGAAAGILYAPDKGTKTRKDISKKAKKQQDKLAKQLKETRETISQSMGKASETFEERLNETISSASHKAEDVITSLETKLADLRKQNAKHQAEASLNGIKEKVKKITS